MARILIEGKEYEVIIWEGKFGLPEVQDDAAETPLLPIEDRDLEPWEEELIQTALQKLNQNVEFRTLYPGAELRDIELVTKPLHIRFMFEMPSGIPVHVFAAKSRRDIPLGYDFFIEAD